MMREFEDYSKEFNEFLKSDAESAEIGRFVLYKVEPVGWYDSLDGIKVVMGGSEQDNAEALFKRSLDLVCAFKPESGEIVYENEHLRFNELLGYKTWEEVDKAHSHYRPNLEAFRAKVEEILRVQACSLLEEQGPVTQWDYSRNRAQVAENYVKTGQYGFVDDSRISHSLDRAYDSICAQVNPNACAACRANEIAEAHPDRLQYFKNKQSLWLRIAKDKGEELTEELFEKHALYGALEELDCVNVTVVAEHNGEQKEVKVPRESLMRHISSNDSVFEPIIDMWEFYKSDIRHDGTFIGVKFRGKYVFCTESN